MRVRFQEMRGRSIAVVCSLCNFIWFVVYKVETPEIYAQKSMFVAKLSFEKMGWCVFPVWRTKIAEREEIFQFQFQAMILRKIARVQYTYVYVSGGEQGEN